MVNKKKIKNNTEEYILKAIESNNLLIKDTIKQQEITNFMVFSQPNKNRSNENNLKFGLNTSNQI